MLAFPSQSPGSKAREYSDVLPVFTLAAVALSFSDADALFLTPGFAAGVAIYGRGTDWAALASAAARTLSAVCQQSRASACAGAAKRLTPHYASFQPWL